jgi:hypothetical protein
VQVQAQPAARRFHRAIQRVIVYSGEQHEFKAVQQPIPHAIREDK